MQRDDLLSYLFIVYAQFFRIYNSYILTPPLYVWIILCLEMLCIIAYPLPCYVIFSWLGCSPYPMREAPASYPCLMALTLDWINSLCRPLTITFYALLSQRPVCHWTLKNQWTIGPSPPQSMNPSCASLSQNGSFNWLHICVITTCRATTLRALSPTPFEAPIKGAVKPFSPLVQVLHRKAQLFVGST